MKKSHQIIDPRGLAEIESGTTWNRTGSTDVYFGRAQQIKSIRHQIKMKTLKERRKINRKLL